MVLMPTLDMHPIQSESPPPWLPRLAADRVPLHLDIRLRTCDLSHPKMTTRFAPSPTGHLHIGHAYAAVVARDLTRDAGGTFLLRFEDIDFTRVRPEYYDAIEEDLRWLDIEWSGTPLRQTDRQPAYAAALDTLREQSLVYPCFCTRKDIQIEIAGIANAPHGPEGPLYPGTCRDLAPDRRNRLLNAGHPHCWRLDATAAARATGPLTFTDRLRGTTTVDPGLLGDVILARKDIATSYHLAVVVDDAYQGITHVTRGSDLVPSTHVHRLLQALLGLPEPAYHHHALVSDADGKRLAKRDRATTLRDLRESGLPPDQVSRLIKAGLKPT